MNIKIEVEDIRIATQMYIQYKTTTVTMNGDVSAEESGDSASMCICLITVHQSDC